MSEPSTIFVSLQVPGADTSTAVQAHRAVGLLTEPDIVVFPALAPDVLDTVGAGHVLIAPQPPDEATAQRLRIAEISTARWHADDAAVTAKVRLGSTASAVPVPPVAVPDWVLGDAPRAGGLWDVFARLGIPDPPEPAVALDGLSFRYPDIEALDTEFLGFSFCWLVPWCNS